MAAWTYTLGIHGSVDVHSRHSRQRGRPRPARPAPPATPALEDGPLWKIDHEVNLEREISVISYNLASHGLCAPTPPN